MLIAQLTTTGSWDFVQRAVEDNALNVYSNWIECGFELVDFSGLTYELVGENTTGDGFDTYRVYANFIDPGAQLTAVCGLQDTALSITTTGSFYQDAFGGPLATAVNPLLFPTFPELEYDSGDH